MVARSTGSLGISRLYAVHHPIAQRIHHRLKLTHGVHNALGPLRTMRKLSAGIRLAHPEPPRQQCACRFSRSNGYGPRCTWPRLVGKKLDPQWSSFALRLPRHPWDAQQFLTGSVPQIFVTFQRQFDRREPHNCPVDDVPSDNRTHARRRAGQHNVPRPKVINFDRCITISVGDQTISLNLPSCRGWPFTDSAMV